MVASSKKEYSLLDAVVTTVDCAPANDADDRFDDDDCACGSGDVVYIEDESIELSFFFVITFKLMHIPLRPNTILFVPNA